MIYNKIKSIILLTLVSFLVLTSLVGCSSKSHSFNTFTTQLTTEEKLEDFEYMYNTLKDNYPFLKVNERLHNINWLDNKEKYKEQIINTDNDEEFMKELDDIVMELNNGHTNVIRKDQFKGYYYQLKYDSTLYSGSYASYIKPWLEVLNEGKVKKWYDIHDEDIEYINNKVGNIDFPPVYTKDIIVSNEVAYLRVESMSAYRLIEDRKEIRSFLEEVQDYEKLIIDIRGNGGGYNDYWEKNLVGLLTKKNLYVQNYVFLRGEYSKEFYEAVGNKFLDVSNISDKSLESYPKEIKEDFKYYFILNKSVYSNNPVNFKGKIYLLVDNGVYSASESFASFCKDTGFATLVGETTGGDGIGITPPFFSLPNSGIVIRYSGVLGLNSDGTINMEVKTKPDIVIENPVITEKYEDDKAIQAVIDDR